MPAANPPNPALALNIPQMVNIIKILFLENNLLINFNHRMNLLLLLSLLNTHFLPCLFLLLHFLLHAGLSLLNCLCVIWDL